MVQVVRAARLFDGRDLVDDPTVVIDRGTVAAVGGAVPGDAEVIDLGDVTLLPGLVDAHQHLCFDGQGTLEEQVVGRTDDELLTRARENAQRALRAGITTIRDLGDRNFITLALRDEPDLPTILAAGPPLTVTGGHCWYLGGEVAGREELLAAVAERKERGCDVVKVMVTGGALTPTFPMWASQFTADEVRAIVEAAHAAGLPVAAHCHGVEGTHSAVDAGVDTIEHCTFFTDEGRTVPDDGLIDRIVDAAIPVSASMGLHPTVTPPPFVVANLNEMKRGFGQLHAKGGVVVVGTDAGVSPGKPHDILIHAAQDLASIALTPHDVLSRLTTVAATVCGVGERKGRIAVGYDADLVAFAGDPTTDLEALHQVSGVWRAGRQVVPG
jgi:imidazolonepropionase-like amidohydrolase